MVAGRRHRRALLALPTRRSSDLCWNCITATPPFCHDRGTVHTVEAKHRSRRRNELRWTGAREGVRSPNGGSQAAQVLRTLTIPVGQEAFEVVAALIGRGQIGRANV